eukprot:gnl/TRDRNA2_/TRDRNA2_186967_c0_seq1.p1 gnl/TRDRNA2_/TRDRNA2_186967_c0~~gnl/TRDRNA2_/TRDRNA2_186967_c0_seq1.p1  ORF type:complete len:288 (-),score=81.48 gnl/TRDRNA2_/TRDRNA2_186967_c0_seq1:318-1181(-)
MDDLRSFVVEVGARLNRTDQDVEPYVQLLEEQWYDSVDSLTDVSAEEFGKIGIPMRFAKELASAVVSANGGGEDVSSTSRRKGGKRGGGSSSSSGGGARDEGKGKAKGKSKGKGKWEKREKEEWSSNSHQEGEGDELEHVIPLEAEKLNDDFPLAGHIIGDRGKNVKYIEQQTGTLVKLAGGKDGPGPMRLVLKGPNKQKLNKAIERVSDLLHAVYEEYEEWCNERGQPRKEDKGGKGKGSKGKGKDKGKGRDEEKGKGKGKSKDKAKRSHDSYGDDEPPRKWQKRA